MAKYGKEYGLDKKKKKSGDKVRREPEKAKVRTSQAELMERHWLISRAPSQPTKKIAEEDEEAEETRPLSLVYNQALIRHSKSGP